ncbi:hypothetical protein NECAME_14889 [Necator americanus]|uniref:Uncharacterized protein n=1 Tax=Necator americanus TaxID=51031 RepID=W2SN09_NECAM|nr:hypothetical protein NECAME_14889 [Necator americanus]ETN70236.1 hypothetical protein NECAME_14889 [Necator americanus]
MFIAILVLTRTPTSPTPLLSHVLKNSSSPVSYTALRWCHRLISNQEEISLKLFYESKCNVNGVLRQNSFPIYIQNMMPIGLEIDKFRMIFEIREKENISDKDKPPSFSSRFPFPFEMSRSLS